MTDAVSPYAYVGNSPVNFVDPFGWAAQGATITTQSAYASATATDWTTPVGGGQTGEQYVQAQMLLRTVPAPPTGPNPGYQGITVPGGTGTRVNPLTDIPVTTPPSLADQIAKGIHDALIRPILDGANALGNFILEQIGANSGDKPTAPGDVLAPNGQPVGDMAGGAGLGVRTVTPGQLDGIIDGL